MRAEVVPPLGDAMRFVNRKQGDLRAVEQAQEVFHQQSFRRDVNHVDIAALNALHRFAHFFGRHGGIDGGGADAELFQRLHLILHQRDERRDDDARALAQHRGYLVAKRLAAARGHENEAVAALRDMRNDFFLRAAEAVVAVGFLQYLARRHLPLFSLKIRLSFMTDTPVLCYRSLGIRQKKRAKYPCHFGWLFYIMFRHA